MAKEMLINVSEGEECRIALLEDGQLEELYMERTSSTSHVGNIYKGKVTNVEAVHPGRVRRLRPGPQRVPAHHRPDADATSAARARTSSRPVGKKMARRDRPPIQRCLRRGDEIIVQIIKEGIGTKGPTLSTYLSIPGRILVMMPGMGKMGVSQKIEDEDERRRLRQILDGLKPPKDVGFIIRTAGVGKSKAEIERDLKYLTRLWETAREEARQPARARRALHRGRPRHPHRARRLHRRRRPDRRRQRGRRQARQGSHQDHHARGPRTRSSCTRSRSRCSTSTASSARSS